MSRRAVSTVLTALIVVGVAPRNVGALRHKAVHGDPMGVPFVWMAQDEGDVPIDMVRYTAKERLKMAWKVDECEKINDTVKLDPKLLDPPVTPYAPWVTQIPVMYITMGGNRETAFLSSMGNFTHDYTRVEAVDGGNLTQLKQYLADHREVVKTANKLVNDTEKRLGCMLSHLKAIKAAYESGKEAVLVLEDDAVPLFSGWKMPLEEYILRLPHDWEASQLQWSSPMGHIAREYSHALKQANNVFQKGFGWGTASYLLHRRAMVRIVNYTWNEKDQQFNLTALVKSCRYLSADDCLLSFTGHTHKKLVAQIEWLPDKTRMLREVYLAAPPLFVHDSERHWMHRLNACEDMVSAQKSGLRTRRTWAMWRPPVKGPRVLLYMAYPTTAGLTDPRVGLLRRNVQTAQNATGVHVDAFLALDDGRLQEALPGVEGNVTGKRLEPSRPWGRMLHLMRQSWSRFRDVWPSSYDYIWALDADIRIPGPERFAETLQLVAKSGALAVAPAVKNLTRKQNNLDDFEQPQGSCEYRYTSRVVSAAPLMAPATWGLLLDKCDDCIPESASEVDTESWCSFLSLQKHLGSPAESTACALLDTAPVERAEVMAPQPLKHPTGGDNIVMTASRRSLEGRCVQH